MDRKIKLPEKEMSLFFLISRFTASNARTALVDGLLPGIAGEIFMAQKKGNV